ncbi:MAG: ribonuclease Z [Anaerolineales bacterium]
MFEIVFLGTSASAPSIHRGLSSQVVIHDEYRFLVDCGEGTQRQILISGLGFKRLNRILITHSHLDHILGLAGLLSTFMRWETIEYLEIYGGRAALERVYDLLFGVVLRGNRPPMELNLIPIEPGVFFETNTFTITAVPTQHRGADCFGYLFEEKSRRPFLNEKAEALGIPPGPWRRELVEGKSITLSDGRVIHPDQVLGEEKRGTRLLHIGDVGRTDNLHEAAQGADALIIEATYLESEAEIAGQFAHLTAAQAAQLAAEVNVGQLILTHISRRYRERDVLQEALAVFPNTVVARDFDWFQIRHGNTVKRQNLLKNPLPFDVELQGEE